MPLVPRHGARVVRGQRDRAPHEPALRQHQGGPRRTSGCRFDLHARGPGHDGPGRVAADGLPHAGRRSILRRHLLPPRAPARHAVVPAGPARRRRRLRDAARGGGEPRGPPDRDTGPQRNRGAAGVRPLRRPGRQDLRARGLVRRQNVRPLERRLRDRAQVPPAGVPRLPAAYRRPAITRGVHGHAHALAHGGRRPSATTSAGASTVTRSTRAGWSPTSRRCSTTTPSSPGH